MAIFLIISTFLLNSTPPEWLEQVADHLPELLNDHANCEKKAAGTALNLMFRYVDNTVLCTQLSKLAREELRHFEQVQAIMTARSIEPQPLSASRYAGELRADVRHAEPERLLDTLIVSAIVEARSCERFERLSEVVDPELAEFYRSLTKSEARHFETYLSFASELATSQGIGQEVLDQRTSYFLEKDAKLITQTDNQFRFHSGPITT